MRVFLLPSHFIVISGMRSWGEECISSWWWLGGGAWQLQPAAERGQEMLQWWCSAAVIESRNNALLSWRGDGILSLTRHRGGRVLSNGFLQFTRISLVWIISPFLIQSPFSVAYCKWLMRTLWNIGKTKKMGKNWTKMGKKGNISLT